MGTSEDIENIPAQCQVQRQESAAGAQDGKRRLRKPAEQDDIEDIGQILQEEGPLGPVQREGLPPPTDIQGRGDGNHQATQDDAEEELSQLRTGHAGKHGTDLEEHQARAGQRADDNQRMESHQAPFEESHDGHLVPAVVVGVSDDKAGKDKKEIHRQIAMVHNLGRRTFRIRFKQVENDYHHRGDAAQSVQDLITGLGSEVNLLFGHRFGSLDQK